MKNFYKLIFALPLFLNLTAYGQANFSANPDSGCDVINVSFTDASTGASSWLWTSNSVQFSTLQNPSATFTTGTYNITLSINGGTSTHSLIIHVYSSPVVSFTTLNDTTCQGVQTLFTSTSTIDTNS